MLQSVSVSSRYLLPHCGGGIGFHVGGSSGWPAVTYCGGPAPAKVYHHRLAAVAYHHRLTSPRRDAGWLRRWPSGGPSLYGLAGVTRRPSWLASGCPRLRHHRRGRPADFGSQLCNGVSRRNGYHQRGWPMLARHQRRHAGGWLAAGVSSRRRWRIYGGSISGIVAFAWLAALQSGGLWPSALVWRSVIGLTILAISMLAIKGNGWPINMLLASLGGRHLRHQLAGIWRAGPIGIAGSYSSGLHRLASAGLPSRPPSHQSFGQPASASLAGWPGPRRRQLARPVLWLIGWPCGWHAIGLGVL